MEQIKVPPIPLFGVGARFMSETDPDIFAKMSMKTRYAEDDDDPGDKPRRKDEKMRYAAYIRISSEDQVGNYSIDAQKRGIQAWVKAQNGYLTKVYVDEAHSGRSADRPGFQQMRRDARKRKFDALVVHKFDRFARNRTDALAIKSLLRYDYGIKVFSVSEPSEDSDGPMGALIEGIMESVADWYSQNLATETTKGKKEKASQGRHNNQAPFGMRKSNSGMLMADDTELPGLRMAFEKYATGDYSDLDVARILNRRGYRTKTDRPFSKETVRFMLRNRTYLGKIRYQETTYNSDGVRSRKAPVQWLEGKHEAVIDEALFEKCLAIRGKRVAHRQPTVKYRPYLLRGLVHCYHCCGHPPEGKTFPLTERCGLNPTEMATPTTDVGLMRLGIVVPRRDYVLM